MPPRAAPDYLSAIQGPHKQGFTPGGNQLDRQQAEAYFSTLPPDIAAHLRAHFFPSPGMLGGSGVPRYTMQDVTQLGDRLTKMRQLQQYTAQHGIPSPGHHWDFGPNGTFVPAPDRGPTGFGGFADKVLGVANRIGSPIVDTMGKVPKQYYEDAIMAGLGYGAAGAFPALGAGGSAFNPAYSEVGAGAGAGADLAGAAPYEALGGAPGGGASVGYDASVAGTVPYDSSVGGYYDPSGAFHAGASPGDFGGSAGSFSPGFAGPGGGTTGYAASAPTNSVDAFLKQYGKYIGAGTSALGQYEQNRIARQEYARAQAAMEANRNAALGYASPENYAKNFAFFSGPNSPFMPGLRNQGEALALGEQGMQEQFAGDVARRNMEGSGLAEMGKESISAARQADYGQALRGFYQQAGGAAAGEQSQQLSASLGAPYQYIPKGPSGTQTTLESLGQGVAGYTSIDANMKGYGMGPYMQYYYAGQGPTGQGYYPGYSAPYGQ